ncbi:unnamed protein product [Amoebophrya sp. A120]|nr:unnamed protein product [Amoebophrya sp. A120]|eukprot:GSA120T00017649001.1
MLHEADVAVAAAPPEKIMPSTPSTSPVSPAEIADLVSQMSFKKKFRAACASLSSLCDKVDGGVLVNTVSSTTTSSPGGEMDINDEIITRLTSAAERCNVVLTTRFTNPIFWQSGLEFFLSLQFLLEQLTTSIAGAAAPSQAASEDVQQEQRRDNCTDQTLLMKRNLDRVRGFVEQAMQEVDEEAREKVAREKIQQQRQAQQSRMSQQFTPFGNPMQNMNSFEDFVRSLGFLVEEQPDPRKVHHLDRHELRIVDNFDEDLTCVICMEKLGRKAKKMPLCGHLFHDACIMESLEHNKSCPMCRDDPLKGQRVFTTDDFRKADRNPDKAGMFS